MSLKPIDIQTNILQMSNAAAEINKQKDANLNNLNYAASMVEKASLEKSSKIQETDKVEAALPPLENELKDKRGREEGEKKQENKQNKNLTEEEKEDLKLFEDPTKGRFIDIKE